MPRCQRRMCITAPTGPREATATGSPGQNAEGMRNRVSMNGSGEVDEMRRGEVGTRRRRRRTKVKVRVRE